MFICSKLSVVSFSLCYMANNFITRITFFAFVCVQKQHPNNRKEPEKYKSEFFNEYSYFLKEGICQDYEFQEQLSKLLLFETSKTLDGELSSLDEYISRCQISQKKIYYLQAPTRQMALDSPYLEAFEKSGKEVLFVYSAIDDFVFSNLTKYDDRELISAEKGGLDLDKETDEKDEDEKKDDKDAKKDDAVTTGLNQTEIDHFCAWLQSDALGSEKIKSIKSTKRLGASPAIIIDHESAAFRRMMKMVESQGGTSNIPPLPKQAMEVNPEHELIVGLNALRESEPELAKVCAEQIYDNCLVAAGLMEDGGRSMLGRLNDILLCVVKKGNEDGNVNAVVEDIADSEDKKSSDGIAVEESDKDEKKDETKEKKDNK
uniref:Uncharacterized protein n=1 Tax=Proboscia inermis TaxID=420281 RepID=A0A7S0CIV2_9STRA|mmetsp:Transcript_50850/g.51256  ORF Transcript_50850/g.51256 Transcript_50850/m.51256 type:complete len:374 (+) Transcript_50850:40-1161(+)